MSVKETEVGKSVYVGTAFNLNTAPFTVLKLNFTNPDGVTKFSRTDSADGITAPAVASPSLPNVGVLPANTYMLYKTQAADFPLGSAGDWKLCSEYEDAAPSKFFGDDTVLTVEKACN